MKNEPLVSIVLPTYNGSRYLAESIKSCLDQTYRNLELILVDDCSTDDTPAIIERFARQDSRIVAVRNKKNQRLPRGLNIGFARSRGVYLSWTSDDNLYEPEAIELMVRYLEAEPATGLVYCDERWIGSDGAERGICLKGEPEALRECNCINACFLYRRSVYETIGGYDADMVLIEDYEYWMRVATRFRIGHLRGVTPYRYRWHPGSLSRTRRAEIEIQSLRAKCRHFVPADQQRQFLLHAYQNMHWRFRSMGEIKAAWTCARACLALDPWSLRHIRTAMGTGIRLLVSRRREAPAPHINGDDGFAEALRYASGGREETSSLQPVASQPDVSRAAQAVKATIS
jgi:glycosyltransferase involved in cell wall biosynthesis